MDIFVEVKSNGRVNAKKGSNLRNLYDHQKEAMHNLDILDEQASYSTLVVLPTGSGKTYTAALWLLRHALIPEQATIEKNVKQSEKNTVDST